MATADASGAPIGSNDGGSSPAPGPAATGWQSAFGDVGANCGSGDEASFAKLPHVTVGSSTVYVGFQQVSSINQDPFIARFDDGKKVYCRFHEDDPPDARAVGITWNGGEHAYLVYTVVGGGTDLQGKGGWFPGYTANGISGGGPKVSAVGRVNVTNGALEASTFIIAVKTDSKVNAHTPKGAVTVLTDGSVEFLGGSAHKPIDANARKPMACSDYPFDTRYRFSADLKSLVCADSTNCTPEKPCR